MLLKSYRKLVKNALVTGLMGIAPLAQLSAGEPTIVGPGTPVTINVTQAKPDVPKVSITLRDRHGHAHPLRTGCTHTGGGIIDIQQPSPDTIVVTMGATAVAYGGFKTSVASMHFDLNQCFEVSFDDPSVKRAKITLDGRVIGLLRSHCKGDLAGYSNACATVSGNNCSPLSLQVQPHEVSSGENLSVNDYALNCEPLVIHAADKFSLHQTFVVTASAPKCVLPCYAPSAEFAPDPALDPLWISYKEPFKGAAKKDYGFQVTLKVADDTPSEEKNGGTPSNGGAAKGGQLPHFRIPNNARPMPSANSPHGTHIPHNVHIPQNVHPVPGVQILPHSTPLPTNSPIVTPVVPPTPVPVRKQ